MRRRLRPVGLRSTLCCDLTTLPARSASAALRGGAPPPALCRSLGRPLSAWAVSDDRLPHADRQPSWGPVRQSVLRAERACPTSLRDAAPLRRRADARRLRATGLRVTHATRAWVALARGPPAPLSRDAGFVAIAACRRPSRRLAQTDDCTPGVPPYKVERCAHVPHPFPSDCGFRT